ncbi:hypothetical protein AK812_SmicGene13198 [Symbiodinium microadriaticum]|uniref:Uncharacterized protein n=1 Tax=Symbiodinium microadriaticum TaxID=2951 RepID=A0A1Q9E8R7_SYMMI|nr:hypothetical protein AK812_SmicGene13198 [Symbiodinium microadriaticum]
MRLPVAVASVMKSSIDKIQSVSTITASTVQLGATYPYPVVADVDVLRLLTTGVPGFGLYHLFAPALTRFRLRGFSPDGCDLLAPPPEPSPLGQNPPGIWALTERRLRGGVSTPASLEVPPRRGAAKDSGGGTMVGLQSQWAEPVVVSGCRGGAGSQPSLEPGARGQMRGALAVTSMKPVEGPKEHTISATFRAEPEPSEQQASDSNEEEEEEFIYEEAAEEEPPDDDEVVTEDPSKG